MSKVNLLFIISFFLPTISLAASFDCKLATNNVEKMICNDAELSYYDSVLGQTYQSLLITSNDPSVAEWRSELKKEQIAWIRTRNNCKNRNCIKKAYDTRIKEIVNISPWCTDFRDDIIWGRQEYETHIAKGLVEDFFDIIGREKLNSELIEQIKDGQNYGYLYRININRDGVDDFVITTGGCHHFYFLASSPEGYKLAPGVNTDAYTNEGGLCANWGQTMHFFSDYIYGVPHTFALIRDVRGDSGRIDIAIMPVSESSRTSEMCRTVIRVSPAQPEEISLYYSPYISTVESRP
jgi:uncharacterized protein